MPSITRDASFVDTLPANVAVQFFDRAAVAPSAEAFRFPVGEAWESVTWQQTSDDVSALAAGLISLGIESQQRVGIASGTRYEWILADLAIMASGAATTTVYPTTNEEDTAYILGDSESRVVFAEDDEQLAKIAARASDLPLVTKIVTFEGTTDGDRVISLDDLRRLGRELLDREPGAVEDRVAAIEPDDLATLIYTSGTTGRPKGVRLRHRSWVYEGEAIAQQKILSSEDLHFLWLPMAHSFGKVLLSTQMACGFATAVDGRVDKIIDNLAVVKPTFMGAAPRIFEKAYSRINVMTASEGGAKEKIFTRAFAVGRQVKALELAGKPVPLPLKLQYGLFDKLVFSKVRDRFGGRVRFFISGSAALNRDIAEWFHAAGILILEGYGLTESAAGSFVNHPDHYKFGTVGPAVGGTEVKLGEGDEVLIKGPGIMEGYHNLPDATAQTVTEDGWLHTGDKGSLDSEGFLTITGRIKDLFKTSGGKYVAPSAIEAQFKALCPYASQFLVFGDGRNYCVALVALDPEQIQGWADENGLAGKSYEEIVTSDAARSMVGGYVEQLNAKLNRWETIKKWDLLDHDLSIESGELTPSMKVKRNVVESNEQSRIDALYG